MSEGLTWITDNADRSSIIVYLALTLCIAGVGLWRKWWVIGWMYTDALAARDKAVAERDSLRAKADERAERLEYKLEVLQEAERRQSSSRSRSRRSEPS